MLIKTGFDISSPLRKPRRWSSCSVFTRPGSMTSLAPKKLWPNLMFRSIFTMTVLAISVGGSPLQLAVYDCGEARSFATVGCSMQWIRMPFSTPIEDLPDECLLYLMSSRYCETDKLTDVAWSLFKDTPPRLGASAGDFHLCP